MKFCLFVGGPRDGDKTVGRFMYLDGQGNRFDSSSAFLKGLLVKYDGIYIKNGDEYVWTKNPRL